MDPWGVALLKGMPEGVLPEESNPVMRDGDISGGDVWSKKPSLVFLFPLPVTA